MKKKKVASRQRKWQLEQIEKGLCMYCPEESVVKGYCQLHYDRKQARTLRWWSRRRKLKKKRGDAGLKNQSQAVTPQAFA